MQNVNLRVAVPRIVTDSQSDMDTIRATFRRPEFQSPAGIHLDTENDIILDQSETNLENKSHYRTSGRKSKELKSSRNRANALRQSVYCSRVNAAEFDMDLTSKTIPSLESMKSIIKQNSKNSSARNEHRLFSPPPIKSSLKAEMKNKMKEINA